MAKKGKTPAVPQGAFDQALFRWYAPEFLRFHRGWLWFLIAAIVDGSLIAYGVLTGSWTMVLVFIVVPVVYLMEHMQKPKEVEVVISPFGIKFGAIKVPYSHIRRFWILHEPPHLDELHILTDNKWHPEVTIPLMGVDPTVLRQYLMTQVPEWEGKQVTLLDAIVRLLRLN